MWTAVAGLIRRARNQSRYYELIHEFEKLTGVRRDEHSFNLRATIVVRPGSGADVLYVGLDDLVMGIFGSVKSDEEIKT